MGTQNLTPNSTQIRVQTLYLGPFTRIKLKELDIGIRNDDEFNCKDVRILELPDNIKLTDENDLVLISDKDGKEVLLGICTDPHKKNGGLLQLHDYK